MLLDILTTTWDYVVTNPKPSIIILLLLLGVYHLVVYPLFLSPLKDIPGPYHYRLTKLFALNGQRTQTWIQTVYDLHRQYGDVVILSPSEISVNGDFKYVQDIYVRNFPKSPFYENFRNHGHRDNMFASLENDRHLSYKKLLTQLYQKSAIFSPQNTTRDMLVEKISQLVGQVRQSSVLGTHPDFINAESKHNEYGKGHVEGSGAWFDHSRGKNLGIDVYSLFASLAMDAVSAFELGVENGTNLLLHPEDRHIIVSHRLQAGMGFWTTLAPQWWEWAATPQIMEASKIVEKWQLELYAGAEANVPKLTHANQNLTSLETLKSHGFYGKDAYSFLSDNIFAGHETTAIQLSYLTYELSRPCNWAIQEKLSQELKDYFGEPTASTTEILSDLETIDTLPFLDALFQENLRVHASIPGAEPRVVDKPYKVLISSERAVTLPRGTTISCQPYSIHRNEDVFPNPDEFLPDRWLQHKDESDFEFKQRIIRQQRYMMPFGKGIRMCLGMNLAMIEMKMAMANLYWRYSSRISPDWCEITKSSDASVIPLGESRQGNNTTDEEKMCMVDAYTMRPLNDECWLRWYDRREVE
ncbi:hypothetical protein CAAN3_05S00628 [[Candida] anglica]